MIYYVLGGLAGVAIGLLLVLPLLWLFELASDVVSRIVNGPNPSMQVSAYLKQVYSERIK